MSKLTPIPCPLKPSEAPVNAESYYGPGEACYGVPMETESSTLPRPVTSARARASGRHAIDTERSKLWAPLYVTALVVLVINIVLIGVSMTVDMTHAPLYPAPYLPIAPFKSTCSGGCAALSLSAVNQFFGSAFQECVYGWDNEVYSVLAQEVPFRTTSCSEPAVNQTRIVFEGIHGATIGSFLVDCNSSTVEATYTMQHVLGASFYHAPGAPRIHSVPALMSAFVMPVYLLLFIFSVVPLVLQITAVVLRAKLCRRSTAYDDDENARCCPCNAPYHLRRLLAGQIAPVVVNAAVTVVAIGCCSMDSILNWFVVDDYEFTPIKTTAAYYIILSVILAVELCALAIICAIYAMRV